MSATVVRQPGGALSVTPLPLTAARVAAATLDDVLRLLDSSPDGLSSAEASARLIRFGPNSVRTHRVSAIAVLGRQLRSAVLGLLAITAVVSFFLGDATQAIIIGVILAASIGLGFVNEYRAERASAALHSGVHHTAVVRRDGHFSRVDVTVLVPGDVIRLALGEVVPADVRLIDVNGLECNESILSGESTAAEKSTQPVKADAALTDSDDLAFMGTIVSAGEGTGMVYATGVDAQFGRIAAGLGERQPETDFQAGLRRFSYLLLWVAMTLTVLILITNLLLRRPVIDSVLFALAIAVGITPQLLPAVVSTSLATGSRRLAKLKVLVKRLVCIEDLGDIDILITDKTGTLTEGRISLVDAVNPAGAHTDSVLRAGLLTTDGDAATGGVSANAMDAALWESPDAARLGTDAVHRIAMLPFDHTRRATSALFDDAGRRVLVVKGAPEQVMATVHDRARYRAPHAGRPVRRRPPRGGRRQQAGAGPDRHHRRRRVRAHSERFPGVRRRTEGRGARFAGPAGGPGHRGQGGHRRQSAGRRKGLRGPGFDVQRHRSPAPRWTSSTMPNSTPRRRTTPSSPGSRPSRRRA